MGLAPVVCFTFKAKVALKAVRWFVVSRVVSLVAERSGVESGALVRSKPRSKPRSVAEWR